MPGSSQFNEAKMLTKFLVKKAFYYSSDHTNVTRRRYEVGEIIEDPTPEFVRQANDFLERIHEPEIIPETEIEIPTEDVEELPVNEKYFTPKEQVVKRKYKRRK